MSRRGNLIFLVWEQCQICKRVCWTCIYNIEWTDKSRLIRKYDWESRFLGKYRELGNEVWKEGVKMQKRSRVKGVRDWSKTGRAMALAFFLPDISFFWRGVEFVDITEILIPRWFLQMFKSKLSAALSIRNMFSRCTKWWTSTLYERLLR